MNEEVVKEDMNKSASLVLKKINPIIKEMLPEWELLQVEGKEDKICKILDMSCGIDYLLHSKKSSLILGVGSRVQRDENYRTFTVRKERETGNLTEYQKRNQAILLGGIYPFYSLQAYIKEDKVLGLAITKTSDLLEFIKNGYAEEKKTKTDKIGQAIFYVCRWDKMKYCGYKVLEYKT